MGLGTRGDVDTWIVTITVNREVMGSMQANVRLGLLLAEKLSSAVYSALTIRFVVSIYTLWKVRITRAV